jgi:hypothetical protein
VEVALTHFIVATQQDPTYSEAWRERGIAENKVYAKRKPISGPTVQESLERAVAL